MIKAINSTTVSTIVVTFNGGAYISKCLTSLYASTVSVQVYVIDNNSTDDTIELIQRDFPQVKLMCLKKNIGFGKANNIGIKYAFEHGADYIFLLNQDAFVEVDTLEKLAIQIKKQDDYALVSPIQLNGKGDQFDYKFANHISKSTSIGKLLTDALYYKQVQDFYEIDLANAAAWMLSRKCVESIGLFNPIFAHYGEDFEYLHRIQKKGLKIGLSTKAIAYHDRNQSPKDTTYNREKTLLMEKAFIRYRLCRKEPGTRTNLLSAVNRALFSSAPGFSESLILKYLLIGFILTNFRKILKMRDAGYTSDLAFFKETPDFKTSM